MNSQTVNDRTLPQIFVTLAIILMGTTAAFGATGGSHYPFGGEGVMAASPPPPGVYYRMYNTWTNPVQEMDDNGDPLNNDLNLSIMASSHRFIYVTNKKILGADYLMNTIIPVLDKDLSVGASGLQAGQRGLGDIVFEPFALHWAKPNYDVVFALAAILPTGKFETNKPASPGMGYASGMLTFGGTYFFDEARQWSFSTLTRTLVNGEQKDTEITPGMEFVMEGGIGFESLRNGSVLFRPGLAYAAYLQTGEDDGDLANDLKKEAYAVGPEFNIFWLEKGMQINLRYLEEFGAKNTTEASQFVLTFTKGF